MADPHTFGYARVSTGDQDLTTQVEALKRYGIREGCILYEKVSGNTMDRPELARLLKRLRAGDTVVVWRLDRLGRTVSGILKIAEHLAENDINLVSLTEHIDTSTAIGKLFFHITAAFAQMERDLISERTKAGMAARRAAGVKFGPPHSIATNPKRLRRYEELFRMGLLDGENPLTNREIAEHLNAADPDAKPIQSGETIRKWKDNGCPGAILSDAPTMAAG